MSAGLLDGFYALHHFLQQDPHFQARQAIVRLPDPDLGTIPAPCVVPRFSGHAPAPARSGPGVGEHNAEVYGGLGLTADDIDGLKREGVV